MGRESALDRKHRHDRKLNQERRTLARAVALRFHRPAMQLDNVPHDGQAQTESTNATRADISIPLLRKAIEDVRQEFDWNANSVIRDRDLDVRIDAPKADVNAASLRRELHGIRKEIPEDLLQATSVAHHLAGVRIEHQLKAYPLCFCARANDFDGRGCNLVDVDLIDVQAKLAGDDAADIQEIVNETPLGKRITDNGIDGVLFASLRAERCSEAIAPIRRWH